MASKIHLLIPVGTQIVTRVDTKRGVEVPQHPRGSVGVIVAAPVDDSHRYRVRFPDGTEAMLNRREMSIRKHHQGFDRAESLLDDFNLDEHIIYRCIIGSRAYGLEDEESDTDRRGIYLPPAEMHWSLYGIPEQLESKETEECYWELQKFLTLALKANPNVLECLYTPLVEKATPLARELLEMRDCFLSQLIYQTYNGYVMSQFKKLEQDQRGRGEIKWKHAMHLIRLLLAGCEVLKTGALSVSADAHRERLRAIKRGEIDWDDVNAWRLALHQEFDDAFASTKLPERPDYERVNAFLIHARREQVRDDKTGRENDA